ncbi:hypothetical protein [Sphingomonas koreensis]
MSATLLALAMLASQTDAMRLLRGSPPADTVTFSCYYMRLRTGPVAEIQAQDGYLLGVSFPEKMSFGSAKVYDPNGLLRSLPTDGSSFTRSTGQGSVYFGANNPDGLMLSLKGPPGFIGSYESMIIAREDPPKDVIRQSEWFGTCSPVRGADPADPFASFVGRDSILKVGSK